MPLIRKAVIPVGGLGTRFLPATKSVPKEMLPVAAKPIVQYAYEEAAEAGVEEVIFITGRHKYAINAHFDYAFELQTALERAGKAEELEAALASVPGKVPVAYIPQHEPLGLGHAVWCARHAVGNEPFALILPDEMFLSKPGVLSQMTAAFRAEPDANFITVDEVPQERTASYGIITPGETEANRTRILGMVEKPDPASAPSRLAITGRYILQPEIFDLLSKAKPGKNGEIQITDSMQDLLSEQRFYGFRFEGRRFDCGSLRGFLEANIAFALEHPHMRADAEDILKEYALRSGFAC